MQINLFPAKSEKIRWIERKEGIIVLNPRKQIYHKLNESASYIWQICNGIKNIKDISSEVAKRYDINERRAQRDALVIVNYLSEIGILELFRSSKRFYPKGKVKDAR